MEKPFNLVRSNQIANAVETLQHRLNLLFDMSYAVGTILHQGAIQQTEQTISELQEEYCEMYILEVVDLLAGTKTYIP